MRAFYFFSITIASLLFTSSASAINCDCSNHIGTCSARASLQGDILTFQTNVNDCAQVTYYVNEEPGSITITGGEGSTNFFRTNPQRQYVPSVRSCDVCRDQDQPQSSQSQSQTQQTPQYPPDYIPSIHMTHAQAVQKIRNVIQMCLNREPGCNENDAFTPDNVACVLLRRMCYKCREMDRMLGYPEDVVQEACPQ